MPKTVSDIFGIKTNKSEFYKQALTHTSYIQDNNLEYTECYERLEFLGDAVLKLTISDILFRMYPQSTEGELSKIRGIVVSDATLAKISKEIGLSELIIMSRSEEKQGGRKIDSICACAFEATLGAFYLDKKYDKILKFIENTFTPYIKDVKENLGKYHAKELLQEYTQGLTKNRPIYTVISESGPAHKRIFEVEVKYNDEVLAVEKGTTKKDAEQKAAYIACVKLGICK